VKLVRRPKSAGTPPTCLLLHRFVQKPINNLDMIAAPVASGNNNRYILSFTDEFLKYAELVAILIEHQKLWQKLFSPDGFVDME